MRTFWKFSSSFWWKELSKETSSEILPTEDGSRSIIKVNKIYNSEKVLKMLDWVLGPKSVEWAYVLHQPDGVGSQRHHIVSIGELNDVSVALMARFGVIYKSTDRVFVSHGGQQKNYETNNTEKR
ncbi:hypothetical protein Tco_1320023 [Tanacetum coccineum]